MVCLYYGVVGSRETCDEVVLCVYLIWWGGGILSWDTGKMGCDVQITTCIPNLSLKTDLFKKKNILVFQVENLAKLVILFTFTIQINKKKCVN